jgi:hypothetical protein
MALVECRECKKDVSTEASKCPHCGVYNPSNSSSIHAEDTLVGLLILGAIFFVFMWIVKTGNLPPDWFDWLVEHGVLTRK